MTTIMGIKAYDPTNKEDYIVLATDSKGKEMHKNKVIKEHFNIKKINYNKEMNLFFAYAGNLLDLDLFSKKTKRNYEKIIESKKLKIGDIEKRFYNINNQFNMNNYLIVLKSKRNIDFLMKIGKEKKIDYSNGACFGTGAEKIMWDILELKLLNEKEIEKEKKIVYPLTEIIHFSHQLMYKAKKEDKSTGGHMEIGIITKDKCVVDYNFAMLKKNDSLKTIQKKAEKYANRVFNKSNKNIESLLVC